MSEECSAKPLHIPCEYVVCYSLLYSLLMPIRLASGPLIRSVMSPTPIIYYDSSEQEFYQYTCDYSIVSCSIRLLMHSLRCNRPPTFNFVPGQSRSL